MAWPTFKSKCIRIPVFKLTGLIRFKNWSRVLRKDNSKKIRIFLFVLIDVQFTSPFDLSYESEFSGPFSRNTRPFLADGACSTSSTTIWMKRSIYFYSKYWLHKYRYRSSFFEMKSFGIYEVLKESWRNIICMGCNHLKFGQTGQDRRPTIQPSFLSKFMEIGTQTDRVERGIYSSWKCIHFQIVSAVTQDMAGCCRDHCRCRRRCRHRQLGLGL